MAFAFRTLPFMAAAGVLLLAATPTFAQKPEWKPIAELLVGSLGTSDPAKMSDVMSRCTALNMILSGMAAGFAPDMAEHYKGEAHRFIQNGVLIESQIVKELTGAEPDITELSNLAIEEVKILVEGYNAWLDHNIADSGSYFNKDIDMEIESCQLAGKLAARMEAE